MTDDDLTTAYILGVEHIRDKMHKQADEIERLRAENETLRRDVRTAVMGDSAELADVKRENEKLRTALKRFYNAALEEVDDSEMSWTIRDWWREELKAAAVALKGSEDE